MSEKLFPVLFTPRERREFPLCPRAVPWDMVAPHDARARKNHGDQSLAVLASRGGLDPVELVSVLDDRAYPFAEVTADAKKVKAWAVAELIKRSALWDRNSGPVARLVPAWVWACGVCATLNPARATGVGLPPSRTQCQFCKTIHTAEVPTPPADQPEDDPAAEAACDPHVRDAQPV